MESSLRKRSVELAGHRTSVALEDEFWRVLDDMARVRGLSLARLMLDIDATRGARPLASACRVAALAHAQQPLARGEPSDGPVQHAEQQDEEGDHDDGQQPPDERRH